jgi:DNA topoisomerase-1
MQHTTVADPDGKRLYELIWKRTMASQMADAVLEKTTAKIEVSTNKAELTATGEVMKFEGFTKVYREDRDEEDMREEDGDDALLPPLRVGQVLPLKQMQAV